MPRKNRRKVDKYKHEPTIFDNGFKPGCYGCAFAGQGFVCTTSDGRCLKVKPSLSNGDGPAGNGPGGR